MYWFWVNWQSRTKTTEKRQQPIWTDLTTTIHYWPCDWWFILREDKETITSITLQITAQHYKQLYNPMYRSQSQLWLPCWPSNVKITLRQRSSLERVEVTNTDMAWVQSAVQCPDQNLYCFNMVCSTQAVTTTTRIQPNVNVVLFTLQTPI